MRLLSAVVISAFIFFPSNGHAAKPSFDCSHAGSPREHLICSSDDLAALDRQLSAAFAAKRTLATETEREGLIAEQKSWLHESAQICPIKTDDVPGSERRLAELCLSSQYKKRIGDIEGVESNGKVTRVVKASDVRRFIDNLQKSLTRLSPTAKIISCDTVVRSDEYAGEDEIFGGNCLISGPERKPVQLLMCDGTMVGKFTVTDKYFFGISLDIIGNFVKINCPPGG